MENVKTRYSAARSVRSATATDTKNAPPRTNAACRDSASPAIGSGVQASIRAAVPVRYVFVGR